MALRPAAFALDAHVMEELAHLRFDPRQGPRGSDTGLGCPTTLRMAGG
jgi:hypothetical protein